MRLLTFPAWCSDPTCWQPCAGGCGDQVLRTVGGVCSECETKLPPPPRPLDRASALRRAGVPEKLREPFRLPEDGWPGRPRVDLEAWDGKPWCVLLWGDPGAGKSFLAVELVWRALSRGDRGGWVRAASLPGLAFAHDDGAGLERVQRARPLVIDDIGRGTVAGAWPAVAAAILERYDSNAPTIFTTNAAPEELTDDVAIADRLSEGLIVRVPGGSRRKAWAGRK